MPSCPLLQREEVEQEDIFGEAGLDYRPSVTGKKKKDQGGAGKRAFLCRLCDMFAAAVRSLLVPKHVQLLGVIAHV